MSTIDATTPPIGTLKPYTDPAQLTSVAFGQHSHYAQPHRAYALCRPASAWLDAVGVVDASPAQLPALAAAGVRHNRIEVGWCQVAWDESGLTNAGDLTNRLQSCKAADVRPLILLNAHEGVPCPTTFRDYTVAAAVAPGDTAITLADASGLTPFRSGLTNVTGYTAARPVFTAVSGNAVTLAQPCPVPLAAGQVVSVSTVKYRPWGPQGSPEYLETLAGWRRYMTLVGVLCRSVVGAGGFDLEVWNELTFGSDFLDAANYGLPAGPDMAALLPQIAAQLVGDSPHIFDGVRVSDGTANTMPWPASSKEPAEVTAISKHPYHGRVNYPADNLSRPGIDTLDALGQPTDWVPTYTALLPEYFGTLLQTESALRDVSPLTTDIYGTPHGALARAGNPCPVWLTEYAMTTNDGADPATIDKAFSRAMAFWVGVGAERLYWFDADSVTAGQLQWLSRVRALLTDGLDAATPTRTVTLDAVSDTHGHIQWSGDGTPAHPDLSNRACFAFFPYQVSAKRFIAMCYVVTRDVAARLEDEDYTLTLGGVDRMATYSLYDVEADAFLPVLQSGEAVTATFSDRPRLLIIDLP